MKQRATVKEIMTTNLKSISLHDGTIQGAKDLMEENGIRHLPVTNGAQLAGIISLTDIKRVSFGANFGQEDSVDKAVFSSLPLRSAMVQEPKVISSTMTIKETAEILASEEFHALPVVDNSNLVGIVTTTDLIKYLLEQY